MTKHLIPEELTPMEAAERLLERLKDAVGSAVFVTAEDIALVHAKLKRESETKQPRDNLSATKPWEAQGVSRAAWYRS